MIDIVFTGGGTAGHVTPNLALFPELKERGYRLAYIGQKDSIEQSLVGAEDIPFYPIQAGKLRRYLDFQNLTDVFRILVGVFQALSHLLKLKPRLVFSKGGFVSCPVVWAAWLLRIPVMIHESDISPGLANKLSLPFARTICYSFPETEKYLPANKRVLTGVAIRDFLKQGNADKGRQSCGFDNTLPCIVLIGGSQGSKALNTLLRQNLAELSKLYNICHICGAGQIDESLQHHHRYAQFDYVNESLPDLFAMAELIISRAGATSLFEFIALEKANLLIPLPLGASRGDQILNARSFARQGFSVVCEEAELMTHPDSFPESIAQAMAQAENMRQAMKASGQQDAKSKLMALIEEAL